MPKRFERTLTEVELELMQVIWGLGECTIRGVHENLPKERGLAYTSVATMMKILEQKGALSSRKTDDRALIYKPRLTREQYEIASLRHLSENVFRGDSASMVMRLLDTKDLSEEELRSLRKLLDERLGS